MAVILWAVGLSLLLQGCLCIPAENNKGCKRWKTQGNDVCCEECHSGNRLVNACGPNPEELCTPCEPGTFTVNSRNPRCERCSKCVGAQVHEKDCTTTSDTKCGCKEGLICGNTACSFCVTKCDKGFEPSPKNRSCRPCPHGTFNDQAHQFCKPWSTKCPKDNQKIVTKGNAFSDIKCITLLPSTVNPDDQTEQTWPLVLYMVIGFILLTSATITIIIILAIKISQKRKKSRKELKKTPIIGSPTDNPRTLIAIECSFHEAQQEQGSSSESLVSKDSSN